MKSILDQINVGPQPAFRPTDTTELFSLALARQMGEQDQVARYIALADQYPEVLLAGAARRLKAKHTVLGYDTFVNELQREPFQGPGSMTFVVGLRIERRVVTYVTIGKGIVQDEARRELSNDRQDALQAVVTFIKQSAPRWDSCTIALEYVDAGDTRRAELTEAAVAAIRKEGLSLWEVKPDELLNAFGHPRLTDQRTLHKVAAVIWPSLDEHRSRPFAFLYAACLAAHVYVARHFELTLDSNGDASST